MTRTDSKVRKETKVAYTGKLFFALGSLFCLLLILKSPALAVESVGKGISLCLWSVIPSLFPFMVLSELFVSGGLIDCLPRRLLFPLKRLLGLSDIGCTAVLLGLLCGAPVGARCAAQALEGGEITKREADRILTCSLCPSSAFVIGTVGVTLLGDRSLGVRLYIAALLAALFTGVGLRLLCGDAATPQDFAPTHHQSLPLSSLFTGAVAQAAKGMLLISAYVVFFSALMGTLTATLAGIPHAKEASALLFCLLELSGGVGSAAALGDPLSAVLLCAFCIGWSGLSVHCQIQALCRGSGISLRPYLGAKLVQGLLCPLLTWLSLQL